MQKPEVKVMQSFIDKLCDHLPMQRVKVLIDNGFDEWETVTFMKGDELIQLGFDTQECIIIMVAANSTAAQNQQTQIFNQSSIQQTMAKAKQCETQKHKKILQQQQCQHHKNSQSSQPSSQNSSQPQIPSSNQIKQMPVKQISQSLLIKGTFMKTKPGQKVNLSKAHMITLQQKQITHIANLQKCPNLVNLHLGNNFIYRIQGMAMITKLKMLKLEHNNIQRIQGLDALVNLQHLYLSNNYISRLQNLTNNPKLQQLYISKQKIKTNFTFDPSTMQALGYTLEKLQCNQNKIKNITNLKYLHVVKEVYLMKNQLDDVGELSETINGMTNLRMISFKDNPLTKSQKYRDYMVILSKTLEELDGKKILQKEREYLVKLYALKHAKQNKEEQKPKPQKPTMDLHGVRMQEQYSGQTHINKATDLRGNIPHANTKHYNNR